MRNGALVAILCGVFAGCAVEPDARAPAIDVTPTATSAPAASADRPPPAAAPAATEDPEQAASLRSIAASYATKLKKVTSTPHVAPALCAAMAMPVAAHYSASDDASTHGKKIYFLYAADGDAYVRDAGKPGTTQPATQVLVKEAWTAVPADGPAPPPSADRPHESVFVDGKALRAGERSHLFVMARHGSAWQFGLVAPDGAVTTEGPATKSCHGCHDAKPDGLFGLPR